MLANVGVEHRSIGLLLSAACEQCELSETINKGIWQRRHVIALGRLFFFHYLKLASYLS